MVLYEHWKYNLEHIGHLTGDGDSRHIGYKVEMPGAYEIASSDVTVERVPEKADLVIPVATGQEVVVIKKAKIQGD
ncbi:hypothetical protein QN277_025255 [Acacia crassicarpa]|uniref:Uncharacterized protein n=1 Tax=Acacia crassicarpa TaxID=499986 RepID=A0AAE1JDX1_9FABA|nr:hypothetical protein QN277_025255 [Acacia crassicarpa]